MNVPIYQVDAFAHEPFRGNPAGVCLPNREVTDSWMQGVAAEMNVSETAFLLRREDRFAVRYFTPAVEVPLCGHATLSSAHVLWEAGIVREGEEIHFSAKGGELKAAREDDWIRLDFPTLPVSDSTAPPVLSEILGAEPVHTGRLPGEGFLFEFDSEKTTRGLRPDFARLRSGRFGPIIATARADAGSYDFVSRFFAPDFGIDEDPVTGIAHCSLAPYWSARLGKRELVGHQVSSRGGIVRVRERGTRTEILGRALTVMKGEILI